MAAANHLLRLGMVLHSAGPDLHMSTETGTGWRPSTTPDRCLQALWPLEGRGGCLGCKCHANVLGNTQPAPG